MPVRVSPLKQQRKHSALYDGLPHSTGAEQVVEPLPDFNQRVDACEQPPLRGARRHRWGGAYGDRTSEDGLLRMQSLGTVVPSRSLALGMEWDVVIPHFPQVYFRKTVYLGCSNDDPHQSDPSMAPFWPRGATSGNLAL